MIDMEVSKKEMLKRIGRQLPHVTRNIPVQEYFDNGTDVLGMGLRESHRISKYHPKVRLAAHGIEQCIFHAVINAFYHGNKMDANLPVNCVAYVGDKGVLYEISDQGNGFDVNFELGRSRRMPEEERTFRPVDGQFYHSDGKCYGGMHCFDTVKGIVVSYNRKGNTVYILAANPN